MGHGKSRVEQIRREGQSRRQELNPQPTAAGHRGGHLAASTFPRETRYRLDFHGACRRAQPTLSCGGGKDGGKSATLGTRPERWLRPRHTDPLEPTSDSPYPSASIPIRQALQTHQKPAIVTW